MSDTAFTLLISVKRRDFISVQRLFTLNLLLPSQMVPDGLYSDGVYTVTNDLVGELLQACAPTLLHGKIEVPKKEVSAWWDGLQPVMPQDLTIDIALLNRRYHNEGSPLMLEKVLAASAELYTSNGKLFSSYTYEGISVGKHSGMCELDLAAAEGLHIVAANNYIFDGVSVCSRQAWTNKGVAGDHMSREKAKIVAALCSGIATRLDHETVADEV